MTNPEAFIQYFKKLILLFLGTSQPKDAGRRSLKLALAFPVTRWVDWALVGCTAGLVAFLKEREVPNVLIFFILWQGNMLVSGAVVYVGWKTRTDLTLMEGVRRLIDKAIEKSAAFGLSMEIALCIRLVIWDGADQFIIFFHKRLKSPGAKIATFVVVSGVQMAIWTVIFVKGYESLTEALF